VYDQRSTALEVLEMRRFFASVLVLLLVAQSSGAALAAAPGDESVSPLVSFVTRAGNSMRGSLLFAELMGQPSGFGRRSAPPVFDRTPPDPAVRPDISRRRGVVGHHRFGNRHDDVRYPHAPPDPRVRVKDKRMQRLLGAARGQSQTIGGVRLRASGSRLTVRPHSQNRSTASTATTGTATPADAGTGINHWWAYEERSIPGLGRAMVNVASGNLLIQATDVAIPERGLGLVFQRTWNSQSLHDVAGDDGGGPSIEGNGWTSTFDSHLVFGTAGTSMNESFNITVYDIDGTPYVYTPDVVTGAWDPPAGQHAILEPDPSEPCSYWWIKKNGTAYWYHTPTDTNASGGSCGIAAGKIGKLYEIVGRNANDNIQLAYTWANANQTTDENITTIVATHSDGQSLTLNYEQKGSHSYNELSSINIADGTTIQYFYDNNGNLVEVDKPGNEAVGTSSIPGDTNPVLPGNLPETYDLTETGSTLNQVCGPRGAIATYGSETAGACLSFTLNASNQLTTWETTGVMNFRPGSPDSSAGTLQPGVNPNWANWNKVKFAGYSANVTTMSDADGHATNWTTDSFGRPIEIQQWDSSASPAATPPGTWLTTTQAWDADNNLVAVIGPRGNSPSVNEPGPKPNTYETDYSYDAMGNTLMVSLPAITTNVGTIRPTSTYSYDAFNNVLSYCDPAFNAAAAVSWGSTTPCSTTHGSASVAGPTAYLYDNAAASTTDSSELYGRLVNTWTPLGYKTTITYQSAPSDSLPMTVSGAQISQPSDSATSPRTPTQTFGWDSLGNLTSYDKGEGPWMIKYDTQMNRVLSRADPDGVKSYICYNLDGSVLYTETAYQHVKDGGAGCPVESSTAPAPPSYAVSYTYDADGDTATELHHHGGTYNTSGSVPAMPTRVGTTTKFYDGLDRLVEVVQSRDAFADVYTSHWMTRYLYDLSQGASGALQPQFVDGASGSVTYPAYGNLYKTQEYLSASLGSQGEGSTTSTPTLIGTVTNTTWQDLKGTAFDSLNRPINKYSFVNLILGGGNIDAPEHLSTETLTYDGNTTLDANLAGLLAQDCNDPQTTPAQQCQYFDYNADGLQKTFSSNDANSPQRTYVYDPDGRPTSITATVVTTTTQWNEKQSYTYDANGRLITSTDPTGPAASGITDGGSTITHNYYPDGKESSLDVSSSAGSASVFTQAGLFKFGYRTDGLLEAKVINDASLSGTAAKAGTTTITYAYTPGGRMLQRNEAGAGANPAEATAIKTWSATYGFEMTDTTTQLPLTNFQYGPEGDLLGFSTTGSANAQPNSWAYTYTTRGELSSWPSKDSINGLPAPDAVVFANGVAIAAPAPLVPPNAALQGTTWDERMSVVMESISQVQAPTAKPSLTYSAAYDVDGRLQTANLRSSASPPPTPYPGQTATPPPPPSGEGGTYDAENHPLLNGSLTWGPNGHPILIGKNGPPYETLHWNGNQILFSTATIGGTVQVDDIKIGMEGDITPADAGYSGLTFYDRAPDGTVMGCHNQLGTAFAGIGGDWTGQLRNGVTRGFSPCGDQAPTSIQWGTSLGAETTNSGYLTPSFGSGGILGVPRGDGYAFGYGTIQGVRAYDGSAGTWTTPDAFAGDVDDPSTQKSYMYSGNNPVSYSDPSGYSINCGCSTNIGNGGDDLDGYDNEGTLAVVMVMTSPETQNPSKPVPNAPSQSAVPSGVQVEPSQTQTGITVHEDYWFYQLMNANNQPVTGKGNDYMVIENVFPVGCNDGCNSNGKPSTTVGTEIEDGVGGYESSMIFQTFSILYQNVPYDLPDELVHEVYVGSDGTFSTRVFSIAPDLPTQPI
jgi:YD repeat-containing protein